MRRRCNDKKDASYCRYGAKGIKVCDRWLNDYDSFYLDMGDVPDGMTLDRINCKGNYEPSNCRWATCEQQQNNKSSNRSITFSGITLNAGQWASKLGIRKDTLCRRLNVLKMPLEKALIAGRVNEWQHGTRHGYEKGCRCLDCKAAHAERHRRMRAKRKQKKMHCAEKISKNK